MSCHRHYQRGCESCAARNRAAQAAYRARQAANTPTPQVAALRAQRTVDAYKISRTAGRIYEHLTAQQTAYEFTHRTTQTELAAVAGVSLLTAHRAIQALKTAGMLTASRGQYRINLRSKP